MRRAFALTLAIATCCLVLPRAAAAEGESDPYTAVFKFAGEQFDHGGVNAEERKKGIAACIDWLRAGLESQS